MGQDKGGSMTTVATPVEVNTLVVAFRSALRAIVPIAETIGIRWREPDNYDEWDWAAKGLFEGFVLAAIRSSDNNAHLAPFAGYDERLSSYNDRSFIAAKSRLKALPFVCFETASQPFDICLLAEVDNKGRLIRYVRVPSVECMFVAELSVAGVLRTLNAIT